MLNRGHVALRLLIKTTFLGLSSICTCVHLHTYNYNIKIHKIPVRKSGIEPIGVQQLLSVVYYTRTIEENKSFHFALTIYTNTYTRTYINGSLSKKVTFHVHLIYN